MDRQGRIDRDKLARKRLDRGVPMAEVARKAGLTARQVRNRMRIADGQAKSAARSLGEGALSR